MQKKSRGEHPASLFVTLFILVTIGSYSYIVVPLCHCLCKTLFLSVSIYNIQTTVIKQTNYGKFHKNKNYSKH